jgi:hypothetical protein
MTPKSFEDSFNALQTKNIVKKPFGTKRTKRTETNNWDKTYRKLYISGQKLSGDKTYRDKTYWGKAYRQDKTDRRHNLSADLTYPRT